MVSKPLAPGMIVFVEANGEEAAPGWYRVLAFDHDHSREYPEDGWWWTCERLCDGLHQTVAEKSQYLHTDIEGKPAGKFFEATMEALQDGK